MSQNLYYDPYWDRYSGASKHRAAGYVQVLAIPGRAEQAAEFNEAQSIQRDYLERLGKAVLSEGQIISGCNISVNGTMITISAGRVFLDGLVREVKETKLQIRGLGTERVMASLETSTVSSDQDPTLRDPAVGADNYNLVGADRLQQLVVLSVVEGLAQTNIPYSTSGSQRTIDTATASLIYSLEDGEVIDVAAKQNTSDSDSVSATITDMMAERTYDENGNYKVRGLNLSTLAELDKSGRIKVYISDGRAYIKGYQVVKDAMSQIRINRSTDTRLVQSESHFYKSTQSRYQLSNGPIDSMVKFTALVTVTEELKYRGSVRGGLDKLSHTPVDSITQVYTKNNGRIDQQFVQGRDYALYADGVDWSLTGDDAMEPASGTSYYVTYVYNKLLVEGTDFSLENDIDTAYVNILNSGTKPDHNTRMYFNYYYTLARRDLVLVNSAGEISVLEGKPDRYDELITPYNGSDYFYELGYVNVFPKPSIGEDVEGHIAEVVSYDQTRLTQDNFNTMLKRIEAIEDSLAQLDLEREIETGEDSINLKGYFTDNFENINKSDIGYDTGSVAYTACIDYARGELTTPASIVSRNLSVNNAQSPGYNIFGTILAAPYESELVYSQGYATGKMLVNPYASYGPMCIVSINPSQDNWIEEETIKVTNTIEKKDYTTKYATYSHAAYSWNATRNLRGFLYSYVKEDTTFLGRGVERVRSSSVAATVIEFMRQGVISVEGSAFGANSKNIYCLFNDVPVNLEPTGTTSKGNNVSIDGASYATVNANGNGHFTAKFIIPERIPCGEVAVQLICSAANNSEGVDISGRANYTARGTLLTTTELDQTIITDRYQVLKTTVNVYRSDPLAQSFILSDTYDRNLTEIGLYFATKSTTRPALLQVRNMVNGYPGETVYAEVELAPEKVNIPTNANIPVVTRVKLNQPVYCYAGVPYCFVVLSDSNAYSMYYANMGDNLLGTSQPLVVNPYGVGVMFSSSNATTWTAHQGADLKFDLYRSVYTGKGEIIFEDVNLEEVTGVMLDAAYEVAGDDKGSSSKSTLSWYFRYAKAENALIVSDWIPIDTFVYKDLASITSKVTLKAVIETDYSTSPFIDGQRISLRAFIDALEATYVSKHLSRYDFEDEYQKLKIMYQAAIPTGALHPDIYYMDQENGEWVKVEENANNILSITPVDDEFYQYTWNINKINCMIQNPTSAGSTFFKIRIDMKTAIRYSRPRVRKLMVIFKYAD